MTLGKKRAFLINCLFAACLLALAWLTLHYLLPWMLPFLIALAAAACLQRPVNWLTRRGGFKRRFVAPLAAFLLVFAVASAAVLLLWSAASELGALAARLPGWYNRAAPAVASFLEGGFERLTAALPPEVRAQVESFFASVMSALQAWVISFSSSALGWLAQRAGQLPSILVTIIVTVVATFFLTVEFDNVRRFFRNQIPPKYRALLASSWSTFGSTLVKMLRSYLLIMFITFVELAVGLLLLRINYAVLLAAIISLVDILPVLGTGTILIPWGVVCLILGETGLGVGVLAVYLVITVVRNFLEPRMIGNRIGLHPLATLVFMYLGLKSIGLVGMFLFPLAVILLKNLQDAGAIRLWKTGDPPEPKA